MFRDEDYMQRCIELARRGLGKVRPNPMVGAVVVHNNRIIGEGYHEQYGQAHAEVNAIAAVADQHLLSEATVYVSLEPCAHHGKTPPCADLLVRHQVKRVVVGCVDSYSEVSGKGIEKLRSAGIEVTVGILEQECRNLNKRFFTFHEQKRPYVILKWAQTRDGYMDPPREKGETGIRWITQPGTKRVVHKWRAEEAAILIGKHTALNDDPSLTVREWVGEHPVRILLDSNLEVPESAALFRAPGKTIVLNTIKEEQSGATSYLRLDELSISAILTTLYEQQLQSVIVEGGARVLNAFLNAGSWDEARVLTGIVDFGGGTPAPVLNQEAQSQEMIGKDTIRYYFRK